VRAVPAARVPQAARHRQPARHPVACTNCGGAPPERSRGRRLTMPRPPIPRLVEHIPKVTYFKPAGIPLRLLEEVELTVDELEAIRLKDIEGLEQEEAAARMGIARTTFRRVLVSARAKIAEALVKGKAIRIEGGPFVPARAEGDTGGPAEPPGPGPHGPGPRWAHGPAPGRHRRGRGW